MWEKQRPREVRASPNALALLQEIKERVTRIESKLHALANGLAVDLNQQMNEQLLREDRGNK